jgi:GntR family transcriptional regulator
VPAHRSAKRPATAKSAASTPAAPFGGAAIDFSRNLVPIYLQLVTIFRRLIVTGQWPLNSQIPTLEELAAQFGVARATVRHAIGFLEHEGLLARYRRHGTFVVGLPQRRAWYDLPTSWKGALSAKKDFEVELIELANADRPPIASHGSGGVARSYDVIRKVYRRDGQPYSIEIAYLDGRLGRRFGARAVRTEPVLKLLNADPEIKITRAEQTILIGMADEDIATHLDVPVNAPLAVVRVSVYDGNNTLICESEEFCRGDHVRVVERIDDHGIARQK